MMKTYLRVMPIIFLALIWSKPAHAVYVGNDPVNATDPTGMLGCEGSEDACKQVQTEATFAKIAVDATAADIANVREKMGSGEDFSKNETATLSTLSKAFPDVDLGDDASLGQIQSVYEEISNILDPANKSVTAIALEQDGGSALGRQVGIKRPNAFYVFKNAREPGVLGPKMTRTLVHEPGHNVLGQSIRAPSEGYRFNGIQNMVKNGGSSLTNADSFACGALPQGCY